MRDRDIVDARLSERQRGLRTCWPCGVVALAFIIALAFIGWTLR